MNEKSPSCPVRYRARGKDPLFTISPMMTANENYFGYPSNLRIVASVEYSCERRCGSNSKRTNGRFPRV